jgi:UDP-N-acetylglucosamine 2-epimerase (non-hydrolysing)
VRADFDLNVMRPGQSLPRLTARLLVKLENHFNQHHPDLVLAHGDTTTCFAAALSSFYQQIPFYHVEAGLRSHRLNSPFPEEFNRQSVAPMARHHFAPTALEKANLIKDGIAPNKITITGSTVHDAIHLIKNRNKNETGLGTQRSLVVVTLHRREANQSITQTLAGIRATAESRPEVVFVCPMHPNPSVQKAFKELLGNQENIVLTNPLPYPEFISLLMKAQLVVTDSGGVQEEAAYFGKNVLLARGETERRDGFSSGLVKLIGVTAESTQRSISETLDETKLKKPDHQTIHDHSASASNIIADVVERNVG